MYSVLTRQKFSLGRIPHILTHCAADKIGHGFAVDTNTIITANCAKTIKGERKKSILKETEHFYNNTKRKICIHFCHKGYKLLER